MKPLCALILAAGKGNRMVSNRAKVLHEVCGEPMLRFVCRAAAGLKPDDIFVVIGQDADRVRLALQGYPARFVLQEPQLGTGHAVLSAREELSRRSGDVLVLTGDTPRIKTDTLRDLVEHHRGTRAVTTLLTTRPPDAYGYGRILRAQDGSVTAIVEEKDATPEQKRTDEINAAFYCFDIPSLLDALSRLSADNAQREYYLTDVVAIQRREGKKIEAMLHEDFEELQGINNRRELALTAKCLWREKCLALMAAGVTIIDPDQTYVDPDVVVGKDTVVYSQVKLEGMTRISEGAVIRSGVRITNSTIGMGAEILDFCVITDSEIGAGAVVGPGSRLRNQAKIGTDCHIGNFVEITRSTLGNGTRAAHMSYLGDAVIGNDVNIGAGTITCNFDGFDKNVTIIEDGAFIGSHSQLVAPVRVGKGAFVAAGSCITQDIPAGTLGIARERQTNKPNWSSRRKRDNS
jgi:bifunctional UDP-N-acetylglucosamine pyrophosphorylase / glucosamine-1-phosphate N-acetyltransferase